MTRKWYASLRHPKMYPHTKFGIHTSKNIEDMDRTRKWDRRTDGRTVRLLYASQSSLWGIKMTCNNPKMSAYIEFGEILTIGSQDIERKQNFGIKKGYNSGTNYLKIMY